MQRVHVPPAFGTTLRPHITRFGGAWVSLWPATFAPDPFNVVWTQRYVHALNGKPWPNHIVTLENAVAYTERMTTDVSMQ